MLLWSGITNAGVLSTVQTLVTGHAPVPGQPQASILGGKNVSYTNAGLTTTSPGGSNSNSAIASDALKYVGTRYVWGGHDPSGWDCYGFLTYVLHHDLGYNLPNNTHSGYLEMLAWSGAHAIPKAQVQAGDLIIWPTHCGIAVSSTEMISAENPSKGTIVNTFAGGGPLVFEPMTVLRVTGTAVYA